MRIRLVFADSHDGIRERLVADWWATSDRASSLMIAHRRVDVADLNRRARECMRAAGELHGPELALPGARFAAGDRVVLKRNDLALGVHNGDLAEVTAVEPDRCRIQAAVGTEKRRVELGPDYLLRRSDHGEMAIAHGYAVTGHVAQGLTVRRAFVLAGPGISREWAYAAMSRGREGNHLSAASRSDAERAEYAPTEIRHLRRTAREQLAAALTISDAQHLALDFDRFRGIDRGQGRSIEL